MDMIGTRQLAATQQQAWDALNDPSMLKACIPGCDRFEPAGDGQYAVGMSVKIGPVSARFNGKVTLSNVVPPRGYTIAFEGQGGAAGFGKGTSVVTLLSNPQGCILDYVVKAQVGGKVAQLGQRLIDGAARSIAEDFFQRFDGELLRRHPAPEALEPGLSSITTVAVPRQCVARHSPIHHWVWLALACTLAAVAWAAFSPS